MSIAQRRRSGAAAVLAAWLLLALAAAPLRAHPGSGIAVDDKGVVYFTDTAKGVWKLDPDGKPALFSPTAWHFMAIDRTGAFAKAPRAFGEWFERVSPAGSVPAILECSDFPIAVGPDGSLYYANTLKRPTRIIRRPPTGKETIIFRIADRAPTAGQPGRESYATGITAGPDGSVYLLEASAQADYVSLSRLKPGGAAVTIAQNFVPAELDAEPKPAVAPSSVPPGAPVPGLARSYCRGICLGPDGTVHVAATGTRAILAVAPDGKVRVEMRAESPWSPTDVALAPNGDLYTLEYDTSKGEDRDVWIPRVRLMDHTGKIKTLVTAPKQ